MTGSDTIKLLIKLTPLEPYFFGTDRTFPFEQDQQGGRRAGGYFVRSAQTPSQTTLFGALRYLGIWNPQTDYRLTNADKNRIGKRSFTLKLPDPSTSQDQSGASSQNDSFGMIERISPLYLINSDFGDASADTELALYCKAPFDHCFKDGRRIEDGKTQKYENFDYRFAKPHITEFGGRCFPEGYNAKLGVVDGWLNIMKGTIQKSSDIFKSVENVGNNKQEHLKGKDDGFFKKEYYLMPKHSFAFFAEVEQGFIDHDRQGSNERDGRGDKPRTVQLGSDVVFLGHGRSAFKVEAFTDVCSSADKDLEEYAKRRLWDELLSPEVIYVQSPLFLPSIELEKLHTSELYEDCSFVITQAITHRNFETKEGKDSSRHTIGANLIRLVGPGSIFMPWDTNKFKQFLASENNHARRAGFNHLIGQPLLPELISDNTA